MDRNEKIATHLMGYYRCGHKECEPFDWRRKTGEQTSKAVGILPKYDEDITAALTVVEKLRQDGWTVCMTSDVDTDEGPQWRVDLHRQDSRYLSHVADGFGHKLEEAICDAALQTIEP